MRRLATLSRAGAFQITGLSIQALTLFWVHPLSFILFVIGGILTAAGILLALLFVLGAEREAG